MTVSLIYYYSTSFIDNIFFFFSWFPAEKKTVEDVRVVSRTQDVSVNAEQCPNVISSITSPSPSLTATCTEITYGCTDKSHVLVFSQYDEMCLKKGKASRHCNAEVGFEPPTCKGM